MFAGLKILNKKIKSSKDKKKYYDLTANISEHTVVFPGDPSYAYENVSSLEKGSNFQLCKMHLGNHIGTHIDFPAHVIQGGMTSTDFSIENFIGNGIIIEVPNNNLSINKNFVEKQPILENDFVFFKTSNSNFSKNKKFVENYVYIEPDAADELIKKKVKIVGIDYMSVDKYTHEDLPVHKSLLLKNILIVEGLELDKAPIGRCRIYILPIKIQKMDGLPARVVAEF